MYDTYYPCYVPQTCSNLSFSKGDTGPPGPQGPRGDPGASTLLVNSGIYGTAGTIYTQYLKSGITFTFKRNATGQYNFTMTGANTMALGYLSLMSSQPLFANFGTFTTTTASTTGTIFVWDTTSTPTDPGILFLQLVQAS
ncbi:putative ORFan [Tupanvirus deep ocean]|uniref:ORFan n=2 Tax=Tupanvirus TaxID=2094720 RepID=A0AC62A9W1_9VIRU|nr:putative ORFan [Tupanvirus deep ocean]QKU34440.1 putative ORFan [Tupanvirus deep ocean]